MPRGGLCDRRRGSGGTTANSVPGASGNNTGNDGAADVILWTKDKVYIWEVKPGNEYGKNDGPMDLTRYVEGMEAYFDAEGDDREVERGRSMLPGRAASREGLVNVWSKADYPGMRFYGRTNRKTPTPKPSPLPRPTVATKEPVPEPAPGTADAPMPVPCQGRPDRPPLRAVREAASRSLPRHRRPVREQPSSPGFCSRSDSSSTG